jgi:succinoglycan biosynthesis protein ExoU
MSDCAVVIAAYRAERTIDAALASVAAQHRQPREVVVVDDASPDATGAVARRWSDRLPLTVITLPSNGGPAVARDRGVRAADSSLVALLDADDFWLPGHLSTLLACWETEGGVVSADAFRWLPDRSIAPRPVGDDLPMVEPGRQLCALIERNF